VSDYRAYIVGPDGHFHRRARVCRKGGTVASGYVDGLTVELWEGTEFVGTFTLGLYRYSAHPHASWTRVKRRAFYAWVCSRGMRPPDYRRQKASHSTQCVRQGAGARKEAVDIIKAALHDLC
jgi:hypothetical protein